MSNLTPDDVKKVKGQGFLRNRGTDNFSGRIVACGTVFTAEDFENIAAIAKQFGNGTAICTSRLAVEIPGIPFEKIEDAISFAKEHGLAFGGTGAKIRPVAACKGTTCVFGTYDTQGMAKKIHNEFYLGWTNVSLPHKFKITVGGCPNSCMKPSINDFGIEGRGKGRYKIYVGGTWGKKTRMGNELSELATSEEEVFEILEKSLLWFRENAYQKERFGLAIERIGFEAFEKAISGSDLLDRKEEILKADIKQRG